jgi:RimJ/RimL family protein N-acetyltransferase
MEYLDFGCRRIAKKDLSFWKDVYKDSSTLDNMNSISEIKNTKDLWHHLNKIDRYVVLTLDRGMEDEVIGGFSFYNKKDEEATFGLVSHPKFRGQGLGYVIIDWLTDIAKDLGIKTLKADVYSDNEACLSVLRKKGFRELVYLEKQL